MKLFWWITGAAFAVASSMLIVKYIAENEEKNNYLGNNGNINECPKDIHESEFQETEFVI